MAESVKTAYQSTPVDYLTRITRLFGAYKKRAFEFMDLKPGETLLDAGCGVGDDLLAMAVALKGSVELYGVDMDACSLQTAMERAKAAGAEIDFKEGNLEALPFEDNRMDIVRSDRVFQHLSHPEKVLHEMIRICKPGGRVIAIDVDWGTLVLDHPLTDLTEKICDFARNHHTNGRSGRQLRRRFVEAGLKNVDGYADAVMVPDWKISSYIWGLQAFLERFTQAGGCTKDQAAEWWHLGEESGNNSLFSGSMTGYVIRGTVE